MTVAIIDPMTAGDQSRPDGPCRRCGQDHSNRCTGHSKQTGKPCRKHPIDGSTVCRMHGGNAPQVRAAAEARILEQRVTQMFGQTYNDQPITDPLTAFAMVTGKVVAFMHVAEKLVAELTSPGYAALTGEQIKAEVQLFERALDRCNTVLATHARLNIDARLAAITEAQGRIVLAAIQAALASAGVSGARAIEAGRVAAAKMRVLEAEAAAVNVEDSRERP